MLIHINCFKAFAAVKEDSVENWSYYLIWFLWFCLRTREFSRKRTHGLQLWQSPVYLLLHFHTEDRNIWVFPTNSLLGYTPFHTCRFQWCSLEDTDSIRHPGQNSSHLLPLSHTLDILHTWLWNMKPLAQTSGLKISNEIFFFIPPLAPTKVFLNEGKLNNFSKKVLIYYILQLDRPQPRPIGFTWTHQQFYMSKCLGECLHTPQVTLARFQTAQCLSFQFYQRSIVN